MKQGILLLLIGSLFTTATAQKQLVKLWSTDTILKVPESVFFDAKNSVLYVANIDGEPWGKDGKGSIAIIDKDGKIVNPVWVGGLNSPKGMAISCNLYLEGSRVAKTMSRM